MTHWYVIHTAPNSEAKADAELRRLGYMTWLPILRGQRRRRAITVGRRYKVEKIDVPLWPGYVFVSFRGFPHESFRQVHSADHVIKAVMMNGQPFQVPNPVLDALMRAADAYIEKVDGRKRPSNRNLLKAGQKVLLSAESPFSGWWAEVSVDYGRELRILVDMLGSRREITIGPEAIAEVS